MRILVFSQVYSMLKDVRGFPKVFQYGISNNHRYLVMELLGENLNVFSRDKPNDLALVLEVGSSMVDRLETLHFAGFVHCDVKPHNIALNRETNQWCLFDFGMAIHSFIYPVNRSPLGTLLFMSRGAHDGIIEFKNDIESLAYSLMYVYNRSALPWLNMNKNMNMQINKGQLFNAVKSEKEKWKDLIDQNMPYPLCEFVKRALNLETNEIIDYGSFRKILRQKPNQNKEKYSMEL